MIFMPTRAESDLEGRTNSLILRLTGGHAQKKGDKDKGKYRFQGKGFFVSSVLIYRTPKVRVAQLDS